MNGEQTNRLLNLQKLREAGALTEEEFLAEKAKVLIEDTASPSEPAPPSKPEPDHTKAQPDKSQPEPVKPMTFSGPSKAKRIAAFFEWESLKRKEVLIPLQIFVFIFLVHETYQGFTPEGQHAARERAGFEAVTTNMVTGSQAAFVTFYFSVGFLEEDVHVRELEVSAYWDLDEDERWDLTPVEGWWVRPVNGESGQQLFMTSAGRIRLYDLPKVEVHAAAAARFDNRSETPGNPYENANEEAIDRSVMTIIEAIDQLSNPQATGYRETGYSDGIDHEKVNMITEYLHNNGNLRVRPSDVALLLYAVDGFSIPTIRNNRGVQGLHIPAPARPEQQLWGCGSPQTEAEPEGCCTAEETEAEAEP